MKNTSDRLRETAFLRKIHPPLFFCVTMPDDVHQSVKFETVVIFCFRGQVRSATFKEGVVAERRRGFSQIPLRNGVVE